MRSFLSATLLLAAMPLAASAQATTSVDVLLVIPPVVSVDPTVSDVRVMAHASGQVEVIDRETMLSHAGNVRHAVLIDVGQSFFTSESGDNHAVLPVSALEWTTDDEVWSPISTEAAYVLRGADRGRYRDGVVLRYRLKDLPDLAPDLYTLPLRFTAIAD